jgi:N-methylhydantoinase B/oxoprolinase/acetone carboxylase alpha subunit
VDVCLLIITPPSASQEVLSVPGVLPASESFNVVNGDIYRMNDPCSGGTDIPDIAAIMSVFHEGWVNQA